MSELVERPDIFSFSSATEFLIAWMAYRRSRNRKNSLRAVARATGYSSGYLNLVLSRKRGFSQKLLDEILPHLGLLEHEAKVLHSLRQKEDEFSLDSEQKYAQVAFRYKKYKSMNQKEYEVYKYFSQWLCVTIREMIGLSPSPKTVEEIQEELIFRAKKADIQKALDFLVENNFIEKAPDSDRYQLVESRLIECRGDVYRLALARYHEAMMEKALHSIEITPREQRTLEGLTVGLSEETYNQAREVLREAFKKVVELAGESNPRKKVYHLGIMTYPITKTS